MARREQNQTRSRLRRQITALLILIALLLQCSPVLADMPEFTWDEGVMIYEGKSGDVIYEQDSDERYEPASTTKLMTALVMMDVVGDKLDETVTVGDEVSQFGYESSTAGIEKGQKLTYEELLYAMLLPSGNDAAETIAVNVGRELLGDSGESASWEKAAERFIEEMNSKAKKLGLSNTHFKNAHGLEDADHYTTPADYAIIAKEAFDNDMIRTAASTKKYTIKNLDGTDNELESTNIFLFTSASDYGSQFVEGSDDNPYYTTDVVAAKTGYTDTGGRTFAFYSDVNDMDLIGILFKTENNLIFSQAKAIAEEVKSKYTLNQWTNDKVYQEVDVNNIHYKNGDTITLVGADDIYSVVEIGKEDDQTAQIAWNENYVTLVNDTPKLIAEATAGTEVAKLQILEDGSIIKEVSLYTKEDVAPKNWVDFILDNLIWIAIAVALIFYFWMRQSAKKPKKKKSPGRAGSQGSGKKPVRTVQRAAGVKKPAAAPKSASGVRNAAERGRQEEQARLQQQRQVQQARTRNVGTASKNASGNTTAPKTRRSQVPTATGKRRSQVPAASTGKHRSQTPQQTKSPNRTPTAVHHQSGKVTPTQTRSTAPKASVNQRRTVQKNTAHASTAASKPKIRTQNAIDTHTKKKKS